MSYAVKIIKDSVNQAGDRLTTFELTYPRFIHSEFMTHRMFSRNAASSRAIPIGKTLQMVRENPALPLHWGMNQKGMAAEKELTGANLETVQRIWLMARDQALDHVSMLNALGLHKQLANRILEPWSFITVICTATEYSNFFYLRDSEHAMPEIAWVAREMKKLYATHEPDKLFHGAWHWPYVEFVNEASPLYIPEDDPTAREAARRGDDELLELGCKVSTARCARVSYLTQDGKRDIAEDVALHDRLRTNGHWSPFEHPARATEGGKRSGNFVGFEQYRKQFANEHHGRRLP